MKKLIFLLLFVVAANAQSSKFSTWNKFSNWQSSDTTAIILEVTDVTEGTGDSVDVAGTNSNQSFTDSTYWLINQEDVVVTWDNADQILKYNGWQSTATLAMGGSSTVYVGLACLKTNGDTTAIMYKRYETPSIAEFPYTLPITF